MSVPNPAAQPQALNSWEFCHSIWQKKEVATRAGAAACGTPPPLHPSPPASSRPVALCNEWSTAHIHTCTHICSMHACSLAHPLPRLHAAAALQLHGAASQCSNNNLEHNGSFICRSTSPQQSLAQPQARPATRRHRPQKAFDVRRQRPQETYHDYQRRKEAQCWWRRW